MHSNPAVVFDFGLKCRRSSAPEESFFVSVERLSSGKLRSFYVSENPHRYDLDHDVMLPAASCWTPTLIEDAVVPRLLEYMGRIVDFLEEPIALQRCRVNCARGYSPFFKVCVVRGRWRAVVKVHSELLPETARAFLGSLPHSIDSWTEQDEARDAVEAAGRRSLDAELRQARVLLRRDRAAWDRDVAPMIRRLLI